MNIEQLFDRSLFLTGAGATMEAGCYTSKKMIEELENLNSISIDEEEAIAFLLSSLSYHSKWKSLQKSSFPQEPNIEDLVLLIRRIIGREYYLPYPVTGNWSDKISLLESRQNKIFSKLNDKIQLKLTDWLAIDKEKTQYLNPISNFLSQTSDSNIRLNIFTLNYDLVFEKHFNTPPETLLNIGFTSNKWCGFGDEQKMESRINYYKIHGSYDWIKNKDDGTIEISNDDKFDNNLFNRAIIFGQGNKFLSVEPFISLIYEFKKQLSEKDFFFIIGYSFFDPYINNLIFEGLTQSFEKKKQLIIINPLSAFNKNDEIAKLEFIDYLNRIQTSSYLSELPEFNITKISPNLITLKRMKTGSFFEDYFTNTCEKLINLIEEIDKEKEDVF